MPLQATSGAASQDAFGGNGVAVVPNYIEEVFSTWLYSGTGSAQTITNGIDLSTKGGLVWCKERGTVSDHVLTDSTSSSSYLRSNGTNALVAGGDITGFTSSGFTLANNTGDVNVNNSTNVSWTFRKQPKFFDVVTYTGDGISGRTVAHNLGSVPGCIIVKRTDNVATWQVYHVATGNGYSTPLNESGRAAASNIWTFTSPTSTEFTLNSQALINGSGGTYVAYLFAHNAGGFGLTGTDNVISCGSFTNNGSGNATVSLGYEPQWVLIKDITNPEDWYINDIMRGMPTPAANKYLIPNTSAAEATGGAIAPTSTGFAITGLAASDTYIYIAIRRGPMKVPTTGTSVFAAVARTGTGSAANITTAGFTPDLLIGRSRLATTSTPVFVDRLRGNTKFLQSAVTDAEGTSSAGSDVTGFLMNGFSLGVSGGTDLNTSSASEIDYPLKRAPSFMDVVCYTGTGSARTVSHNLAAVPQLMITKVRSSAGYGWFVYPLDPTKYMELNSTSGTGVTSSAWNDTAPTASVFTVGAADQTNLSGATMVAYLFATCAGVSKVGSYTGTAATLQIDCGFTGGARFVLIKRTDSTGAWYVWDTARGIVSGNDPYLLLNSTAAEVTNTDYIDTYSAGFEISSTAPAAINASAGTFLFLAIA